jgi:transposase
VRILRLPLLEHKPISQLCEQESIHPTLFDQWQKAFFENGAAAFQRSPRTETQQKRDHLVEALEARLKRKDEVIAIIAEDLMREKKSMG